MKKSLYIISMLLFLMKLNAQNHLEGKNVNVKLAYGLKDVRYCSFYEYKIFKNTELGADSPFLINLQNKYENSNFFKTEKTTSNFLKIKAIIEFKWKEEKIICVSYDVVENDIKKESLIHSETSILEIIPNIKEILKLSNDAFWEFYNSENNPNYAEINKLKPQVQDANGTLNIEKLAEVITQNKTALSKYLDQ